MAIRVESVFAFGDSNTAGVGALNRCGWLQRLSSVYYRLGGGTRGQGGGHFYDLTFPGATAETFLRQVDSGEVTRRYKGRGGLLSIVSLGGHDISVNFKDKRGPQERELFVANMASAFGSLACLGDILYVGIPCPDLDFMQRAAYQKGYSDPIRNIILGYEADVANAIASAAGRMDRRYEVVPLFEATESSPEYSVCKDRIHPDDAGHSRILEIVQPVFERMVQLES